MAKGAKPKTAKAQEDTAKETDVIEKITEEVTLSTGNTGSPTMSTEKKVTYVIPFSGGKPRHESLDLHAALQGIEVISYLIAEDKHIVTVSGEIAELDTDEAKAAGIHRR